MAIAHRLVQKAKDENLESLQRDDRLKAVTEWFKAIRKTTNEGRDSELEFETGASAGTGGWFFGLADLFAKFRSDLKFRSTTEKSVVEEVRKRPGDLIAVLNQLVEAIEGVLKPDNRRLVIIVEDLDKLSIADARSVFIENGTLLAGLLANVIYTIPIFTFYSPDAQAMKAIFDHDLSLPMIKVANEDNSRACGFDIVREVIHRRVAKEAIEEDALELFDRENRRGLETCFRGAAKRRQYDDLARASDSEIAHRVWPPPAQGGAWNANRPSKRAKNRRTRDCRTVV